MAISLGWGILFATLITLLMVPINYLLLEDGVQLVKRYLRWQFNLSTRETALQEAQPN